MRSNHRYEIRFQDIVYLQLNEWRAKILTKNSNKKNSTWCVKLMRKQEIRLFLYHTTKCPTKAEKTECEKWVNNNIIVDFGRLNETKYNWILYLRKEWKMKMEKSEEHIKFRRKSINQIISSPYSWQTIIALRRQDESCKSKRGQKQSQLFWH